ncbi:MAG: superoxide dismutase [Pseudanabaena sp.]|nr:MAG: superoxide dismutase [Pseudanabaena sp.]
MSSISKFSILLFCTAAIAITDSAIAQAATSAKSRIFNAKGELVGTASFIQSNKGVKVTVQVQNLNQGEHMIHLHENGKCEAPSFKSAGDHFNPDQSPKNHSHGGHHKHEMPKHGGSHHKPAGDLPNIMVKQDGTGFLSAELPALTLGSGKNSLLKQGGTAIIIHAGANGKSTIPNVDYKTRIACGVVTP